MKVFIYLFILLLTVKSLHAQPTVLGKSEANAREIIGKTDAKFIYKDTVSDKESVLTYVVLDKNESVITIFLYFTNNKCTLYQLKYSIPHLNEIVKELNEDHTQIKTGEWTTKNLAYKIKLRFNTTDKKDSAFFYVDYYKN